MVFCGVVIMGGGDIQNKNRVEESNSLYFHPIQIRINRDS